MSFNIMLIRNYINKSLIGDNNTPFITKTRGIIMFIY